nr:phosphatidylinositol/phosphatidylcholine transfer protein SFH3-like isoform X1 [Ipomoea batatas]
MGADSRSAAKTLFVLRILKISSILKNILPNSGRVSQIVGLMNGSGYQLPETTVSVTELMNMMKRVESLEEKLITLSKEPPTMPPEKEEQLNNALSRVDALEQELEATKKALEETRSHQTEIEAYIEKMKKKKKFFGF